MAKLKKKLEKNDVVKHNDDKVGVVSYIKMLQQIKYY